MSFEEQLAVYIARCDEVLSGYTKSLFLPASVVSQAAEYSLLNGGKRVRGVLTLAVCDMLKGDFRTADAFAAAVEMVHAFSLVHDDLPCMDDDDTRRGKPAAHIVYGEANALLAGDLLAIQAFEVVARAVGPAEARTSAAAVLAAAAGARGMIYGQELDLKFETTPPDEADLYAVHANKTGAMIRAAAQLGAVAAGKEVEECAAITKYAENIGLVFQIVDDVLDVTSTPEVLGKPIGSDKQQGKTTYVTMYGIDASRQKAEELTAGATLALQQAYGADADFLCSYAWRLAGRVR